MATQVVILRFRTELGFALGEVELCQDGVFQQPVSGEFAPLRG